MTDERAERRWERDPWQWSMEGIRNHGNHIFVLPADDNDDKLDHNDIDVLMPLIAYAVEVLNSSRCIGWPLLKAIRKPEELPDDIKRIEDRDGKHWVYPCIRVNCGPCGTAFGSTAVERFVSGPDKFISYARVKLDLDRLTESEPERLACICHELGHALGLPHYLRAHDDHHADTLEMMENECGALERNRDQYKLVVGEQTTQLLRELYPSG